MPVISGAKKTELVDFIEAYEAARAGGQTLELAQFLPPQDHPLFAEVQRQLLIRELEFEAAEHIAERTVWNNGRIGTPNFEPRPERESAAIDPNNNLTTAQVVVRVQSPE